MFHVMAELLLGLRYTGLWNKAPFLKGLPYVLGKKYLIKGSRMFPGTNTGI